MKFKNTFIVAAVLIFAPFAALASETNGTIVTGGNAGYAWSNQAGWVNFGATNSNIAVIDSAITGYAWNSNYGWINMAPTNGGVLVAANGALSGYAWSSGLGWINFSGVSINSSGKFVGTASGVNIGTLTFDCTNCSVTTDFRAQNFRTTIPPPSGGGGGGGGGIIYTPPTPPQETPVPAPGEEESPGATPRSETQATPISEETQIPGEGEISEEPSQESIPEQLFDINFELDQDKIRSIDELIARVIFVSFGKVPTPVDMTFDILDTSGAVIHSEKDMTTVETEKIFTKYFTGAALVAGTYTLRLTTLYNTNVRDTFEAPFSVISEGDFAGWLAWLIGAFLSALFGVLFLFWWRRRHTCSVCKHYYKDTEWEKQCEDWCKTHLSYNPEIVSHAKNK